MAPKSRLPLRWTLLAIALGLPLWTAAAAAGGAPAGACEPDAEAPRAERIAACSPLLSDPGRLGERLGREMGLASEPAAQLARGLALELSLRRRGSESAKGEVLREIESDYINALKLAPDAPDLAEQLHRFYIWWIMDVQTPSRSLVELVARAPDPAALALRLARSDNGFGNRLDTEILLAALMSRPHSTDLWMRAARSVGAPAWKLAFLAEASRNASAPAAGATDVEAAAPIAASWLAELFDHGLVQEMLSAFQDQPQPIRALFTHGARSVRLPLGDSPNASSRTGGRDLRLELAAAHLLAGDLQDGRRWAARAGRAGSGAATAPRDARAVAVAPGGVGGSAAAAARPPSKDKDEALAEQQAARWRQVVERWITPVPDDPFPLLSSWVLNLDFTQSGWALMAARFAGREGYSGFACHLLTSVSLSVRASVEWDPWQPSVAVPARVRQDAERLKAALLGLKSDVDGEIAAARAAQRASLPPDPAAASIARLLARKSLTDYFGVYPMPKILTSSPAVAAGAKGARPPTTGADAPRPLELPPGFSAVRAERQGDRAAAIGVSQDYDPAGEVSAGGYWVVLSEDGGKTWGRPLYTGLRVSQPYVVVERSVLPLLAGDLLQIEVEERELDPASITFPPVALKPKHIYKDRYLVVPLALLRRDSDGDGLTDLAEERLLTDPDDTDHDGRPDGIDLLPQVVQREDESPRTRALTALLDDLFEAAAHAIIEGVKDQPRKCYGPVGSPVLGSEQTLFLVGDRSLFAGIRPSRRVVVLTPEEQAAAEKRFGPSYPTRIELFELDRAGRNALAVWSSSWQGGTVRLEERDGTFEVVDDQFWIT